MTALLKIILFIWELPQNIIGIVYLLSKIRNRSVTGRSYERSRMFIKVKHGAISLGFFIFWSDTGNEAFTLDERNREHEYGHSIQSRMLGPLYLPVVGLPSIARVMYARRFYHKYGREWRGYYRGFPENWADRLGGVDSGAL